MPPIPPIESDPPPFPVVTPAPTGQTRPPIEGQPPDGLEKIEVAAVPIPQVRRRRKPGWTVKIIVGIGAVTVVIGGMLAYKALQPPPPPPPIVLHRHPKAQPALPASGFPPAAYSAKSPNGSNQTLKASGNLQGAFPANRSGAADGPAGESPSTPAAPPKPGESAAVEGAVTIAPDVKATTDDVEAGSTASPAFRSFVDDARIGGVFQGTPPRALINGRIVRGGQIVDQALGIVFSRVDAENKVVVFTDPTGAVVSKKY